MLFNSFHYLVFFPLVVILYFASPHRARWAVLLAASAYFYMVFIPAYILILLFTIIVDYFAGILIERSSSGRKKLFLIFSLISNIGFLSFFKYYNFLNHNLALLFGLFHHSTPLPYLNILLPIGLSFHTFQAMSYTLEVYRGNQKAEKHFGIFALYVLFFPQLVAGPIERPQNVLHQFYERHKLKMDDIVPGLRLIFWGIFKKVMIADNLGEYVNTVYNSPQQHTGLPLIIATLFFTLQIYCDFSGYSDIALGSARILGFRLMTNFSFPYFSRSIREFWGRWHISLSTWFRDYLYIPMGGNRVSDRRWMFNLFLVFVISGIWHGANWTFVVWGVLHGLYLIAGILISRRPDIVRFLRTKWGGYIGLFITFCLVSLAWIFFRARNVSEGFYILEHMGTRLPEQLKGILVNHHLERLHFLYLGFDRTTLGATCIAVFLLFAAERRAYRGHSELLLPQETPAYLRMGITGLSFLLLVFWGAFHSDLDFIYFQF